MATRNPWGKLKEEASKIRTPTLILRAQAKMLNETTGGVIRGRVDIEEGGNPAVLKFSVYVPTLNNYEVVLFGVRQPVTQYPATLVPEWGETGSVKCENDAELEDAVADYCEGPDLQRIVTGLFAQAGQARG